MTSKRRSPSPELTDTEREADTQAAAAREPMRELTDTEREADAQAVAAREPKRDGCVVDGCERDQFVRGLCAPHYILRPDLRKAQRDG